MALPNWIAKSADVGKSAWNLIYSFGPLLISQSESISESYARHQERLVTVDVIKEMMLQEVRTLGDVKKKLLDKFIEANIEDRVRIRHDLEEVDAAVRHIKVGTQALSYLENGSMSSNPNNADSDPKVSDHWTDMFNKMARARNEAWREDLLARALAKESSAPGSVSPRLLWLMGTLEEPLFNVFSVLMDLSTAMTNGGYFIPHHQDYISRVIPQCLVGPNRTIGNLLAALDDCGLFGIPGMSTYTFTQGHRFLMTYGDSRFHAECLGTFVVNGVIPNQLAISLASFYDRKFNPLGLELFEGWKSSVDKSKLLILP